MEFNRPSVTVLLATTFFTAWCVVPQANAQESAEPLSTSGLHLDGQSVITRGDALADLDVMNREGQRLGNLTDFIINFTEGELLYALLATESADDRADADTNDQAEAGDDEDGDDTAADNGHRLYPIPIEVLELTRRADLETDQATEGEVEAEGEAQPGDDGAGETDEAAETGATGNPLYDLTPEEITGLTVYSADNEEVSSVNEVVHDAAADDIRLILGVGGFLGIGEQSVGVPVNRFTFDAEAQSLHMELTREQIRDLPSYEYPDEAVLDSDTRLGDVVEHEPAGSETEATDNGDNGNDEAEGERDQQTAVSGEANGDDQQATDTQVRLEDMVLILDIDPRDLENAPSFQDTRFSDLQDERWHDAVVGFYRELLGSDSLGTIDDTGDDPSTEPSQEAEEAEEAEEPEEGEENNAN